MSPATTAAYRDALVAVDVFGEPVTFGITNEAEVTELVVYADGWTVWLPLVDRGDTNAEPTWAPDGGDTRPLADRWPDDDDGEECAKWVGAADTIGAYIQCAADDAIDRVNVALTTRKEPS